jgi:nicotinate dehydrogenase subunit B
MTSDLPRSLQRNPKLGLWVRFISGGMVEIRVGKVEIGQGVISALAQIAAEELDVAYECIRMISADTISTPNEGVTAGSKSIADGGSALRAVCAEVRSIFLKQAAIELETEPRALRVRAGLFSSIGTNRSLSYWDMAERVSLDRNAQGGIEPKSPANYTMVGKGLPRLDLLAKITGGAFIHDLDLPGMLYGRVVRPPSYDAALVSADLHSVRSRPGVEAVVRLGRFLGVVALREEQAVAAAAALARTAIWEEQAGLPDSARLAEFLPTQKVGEHVLFESRTAGRLSAEARAEGEAAQHIRASYTRPFLSHAPIGPSCAVALWADNGQLFVWSHSQSIHLLRKDIERVVGVDPIVKHVPGSGCYGHNGADDAAMDAVLLAREVRGRPLKLQWSRADEFAWEPFGPAMLARLAAHVSVDGSIVDWTHELWSNPHIMRPGLHDTPSLLAAWHLDPGFKIPNGVDQLGVETGASTRNAVPLYNFPAQRIIHHELKRLPLRTSTLRAIGAFLNVFALESFVDEVALAVAADPIDFRLRYLDDYRAKEVIETAAGLIKSSSASKGLGVGFAFARYNNEGAYAAVAMAIEVEEEIKVKRVVAAVDCGCVVNPDGVSNQIEGGIIQALSWALKEEIQFDHTRITTRSWQDYPILLFSEAPPVECVLIERPNEPSLGVGEAVAGPTAAALGNALYNALGLRIRDLPLTRDRLMNAINDAG